MAHFTALEHQSQIESDLSIRGTHATSDYDFTPPDTESAPPPAVYFRTTPQSEGMLFPFSYYPSSVAPGAEVAIAKVDIRLLRRSGYEFFLCSLVPTQFGPNYMVKVNAHIAAVPVEHILYAQRNFVPLKEKNGLFYFDENGGSYFSVCFSMCEYFLE